MLLSSRVVIDHNLGNADSSEGLVCARCARVKEAHLEMMLVNAACMDGAFPSTLNGNLKNVYSWADVVPEHLCMEIFRD